MKNSNNEFRPDNERLKAIRKSIKQTTIPDGVDYESIVSESIQAYWDNEFELSEKEQKDIELETAYMSLATADRLKNPLKEFFADLLSVTVPVLFIVISILLLYLQKVSIPLMAYKLLFVLTLLGALLICFLAIRKTSSKE